MNAADFLRPAAVRLAPGIYAAAVTITTGTTVHQFKLRRRDRNLTVRRFQSAAAAKRAAQRTARAVVRAWMQTHVCQDWDCMERILDSSLNLELRRTDRRLAWTLWSIYHLTLERSGVQHGS